MRALVILVLVTASVANAQLSPEDAQAKLAERRAAAATQPALPAELREYKQVVAELREANVKLRAEVAQLRAELKKAEAAMPTTRPAVWHKVDPRTVIHVGMTLDEAETAARHYASGTGNHGYNIRLTEGDQQYDWNFVIDKDRVTQASCAVQTIPPPPERDHVQLR